MQLKKLVPRFSIYQLALLTFLVAIVLALVANARRQQPAQRIVSIAFSPDGNRVALGGEENSQVVDRQSGKLLGTFPVRVAKYAGSDLMCFVSNDKLATFGSQSWDLGLGYFTYSIEARELSSTMHIGPWRPTNAASLCPEGFAFCDSTNNVMEYREYGSPGKPASIPIRKSQDRIRLSRDGKSFALFSGFHRSTVPGMPGSTPSTDVMHLDGSTETFAGAHSDALLSPDKSKILLSNSLGSQLHDRETQTILWSCADGIKSEGSSFSNNGSRIAIQCKTEELLDQGTTLKRDQFVVVLDSDTGQEVLRIDVNDRLKSTLALSPDGKTLALAEPDEYFRGVELWDIESGNQTGRLGGTNKMWTLALYPMMIVVWVAFWIRSKPISVAENSNQLDSTNPPESTNSKPRSKKRRGLFGAISILGFLIFCWFSTICFFTMSDSGMFGQLPQWSQMIATIAVSCSCLGGVWLMVFGTKRALKSTNA